MSEACRHYPHGRPPAYDACIACALDVQARIASEDADAAAELPHALADEAERLEKTESAMRIALSSGVVYGDAYMELLWAADKLRKRYVQKLLQAAALVNKEAE